MKVIAHIKNDIKIAEISADEVILRTTEDALDLLGSLYYKGFDKIIIHKKNITSDFFDLKSILAGDILQKFSQYGMAIAIVGDFTEIKSSSLKRFIYESNKGKQVKFVLSTSEALKAL